MSFLFQMCATPDVKVEAEAAEVKVWPTPYYDNRDAGWSAAGGKLGDNVGSVGIDVVKGGGKRLILKKRPVDGEELDLAKHFEVKTEPIPEPGDGEVLVRIFYLGCIPAAIKQMRDIVQFMGAVPLGNVMRAGAVGQIEKSKDPSQAVGAYVSGLLGVQEYACGPAGVFFPAVPDVPLSWNSSFFAGDAGLAAWVGVNICDPKPGKTMLVSAACSVTGAIAAQLGKARGAKVVGIAGGEKKCKYLLEELKLDGAIDYKKERIEDRLAVLCPEGVDCFYDNVGGTTLSAGIAKMNYFGSIAVAGYIGGYKNAGGKHAVENTDRIFARRLKLQGFLCVDHIADGEKCWAELGGLIAEGKMKNKEDIVEGKIDDYPKIWNKLLTDTGERNFGKLIVKIGEEKK
mmetsp:Transcript_86551/g.153174  ORF Transcript_86551/g.153174 Transcript_86551/m.153174 type:complete len:400 (-) Transcript_86551:264-1463(-)|eukprot:CAMPEP_0197644232 /NCGR_PEP_ID=MMETSP1338-20131121/17275_1 /TAXON_ID=43686 ORGANISM="Pelagodinium beii, Strain RCC1491" /NCGR_SAMPLE_ID=MMETSP1338 /ASSEMBLY_ACC=CAM_ASM_000754 /LENGTH=399 /DNA_ID=CAMNT_0043217595 /DNA_START=85 /DNA_END=1284 /DNA_ORIENTATION=-